MLKREKRGRFCADGTFGTRVRGVRSLYISDVIQTVLSVCSLIVYVAEQKRKYKNENEKLYTIRKLKQNKKIYTFFAIFLGGGRG